ncbi:MAG: hypothetical protein F6J99_42125, partial [Moorea sp. SIO4G3]|nr:hypothetical protein [Moorena sp. SIO4G3]
MQRGLGGCPHERLHPSPLVAVGEKWRGWGESVWFWVGGLLGFNPTDNRGLPFRSGR